MRSIRDVKLQTHKICVRVLQIIKILCQLDLIIIYINKWRILSIQKMIHQNTIIEQTVSNLCKICNAFFLFRHGRRDLQKDQIMKVPILFKSYALKIGYWIHCQSDKVTTQRRTLHHRNGQEYSSDYRRSSIYSK